MHLICRARNRIGLIRARVVMVYQIGGGGGVGDVLASVKFLCTWGI